MKEKENATNAKQIPSWKQILLEFIGLIVISLLLGLFLQKNLYTMPFDRFFYGIIDSLPHIQFLNSIFSVFDFVFLPIPIHPQFFIPLVILPLVYMGIRKRSEFWWIVLALFIGGVIARILIFTDTALVYRQRPWLFLPNHVTAEFKEALKHWTSYPSGHTRDTLMMGLIISYFLPRLKYFMLLLALMVGFSRLYIGVHFPTDVLSGLFLGYSAYKITMQTTEKIRLRFEKHHGSK